MTLISFLGCLLAGCASHAPIARESGPHPADPGAPPGTATASIAALDPSATEPLDPPTVRTLQPPPDAATSQGAHAGHTEHAAATGGSAPVGATDNPPGIVYVCPMHPEITSDKPDQRCPKCGMRLVPRREGDSQ